MAVGFCVGGDHTNIESTSWDYYGGVTAPDKFADNCAAYMTSI
jgi:hypothetical protein